MAYTYSSTPVLGKVRIGENNYFLKDADVRAILNTFNDAIVTGTIGGMTEQNKFVYSQTIKEYVDQAVSVGIQIEKVDSLPTASANTMGKIYIVAQSGGKSGDYYNEYITIRSGSEGSYTYAWELIGDTRIDLSNYYTKTQADDKFAAKADLGDMAAADTASGTISTADSAAFSNGSVSASGSYTPAGSVSISGTEGTVKVLDTDGTVSAGSAATFSEGAFTPNTPTAIDVTKFSGGSKAADTFSAGSLPSKEADSFTAGSLPTLGNATTGSFATAGVTAEVGTGADAETLIFTNATTASAVTAQGTFSQGTLPSFTEGAFDAGSLPSFTEGAFTAASLGTGFYTPGTAASKASDTFNGGTPTAVTLPTFKNATVLTDAQATFTGTEATVSVTGTATGTVTLTKTDKTVQVTPDTESE